MIITRKRGTVNELKFFSSREKNIIIIELNLLSRGKKSIIAEHFFSPFLRKGEDQYN